MLGRISTWPSLVRRASRCFLAPPDLHRAFTTAPEPQLLTALRPHQIPIKSGPQPPLQTHHRDVCRKMQLAATWRPDRAVGARSLERAAWLAELFSSARLYSKVGNEAYRIGGDPHLSTQAFMSPASAWSAMEAQPAQLDRNKCKTSYGWAPRCLLHTVGMPIELPLGRRA